MIAVACMAKEHKMDLTKSAMIRVCNGMKKVITVNTSQICI
jgi:hypothetical protein